LELIKPPISLHLIDHIFCLVAVQGVNRWQINLEAPLIEKMVKPEIIVLLNDQVHQFNQRLETLVQIVRQFQSVESKQDIAEIEKVEKMTLDAITRKQMANSNKIQSLVAAESRRKIKEVRE
jgi:hypothetical protein